MFSYLSSFVWGAQEETDAENASEVEHSTREEAGEWLVITAGPEQTGESSKSDSTSQDSECDHESVLSERSWVITPAPTFRVTQNETTTDTTHPLENLLIEHPTMSVYGSQVPREGAMEHRATTSEGVEEQMEEEEEEEEEREQQRARAQAREVVLLRNRQRYQVALQLQIPVHQNHNQNTEQSNKTAKMPLKVTRRATRRHNNTRQKSARGRQNLSVKKCSFVAGRRRC